MTQGQLVSGIEFFKDEIIVEFDAIIPPSY
jgi:hypothetical protein